MASRKGHEPRRRVTMKDVARHAGVSQPTVSFVLNDRRDVSVAPETRARILRSAEELHYLPNRTAQALRSNRSYTVGVVANGIVAEPYAGRIVTGIQRAVQEAGYVCFVVETDQTSDQGRAAVQNLVRQGLAGLIYAAPGPEVVEPIDVPSDIRVLYVNCFPPDQDDVTVVLADEYQGGKDAAAAVFEAGHRDVVYLGGPQDDYACKERLRGLLDAAREAGVDPSTIRQEFGTYQVGSGFGLATNVLAQSQPGVFICGNDRMAVGALMAAQVRGLRCPEDISIVGFDDQPDLADQMHPPLTTVALPHERMGFESGKLLLADDPPLRHIVPCDLVIRSSLAPVATSRRTMPQLPSTHYRPVDGWVGDVIPAVIDGTVWLFFLLEERPDEPPLERATGMPWAAVTTTDFVTFEDHGVVLPSGGPGAVDFDCYTGSVVRDSDGLLHLFYTGHNPRIRFTRDGAEHDAQVVCHATSDGDPTRWDKHPDWTVLPREQYAHEDWRDPFVFRPSDAAPWQMLLATRRLGEPYRRSGLVARLESGDLVTWRSADPLWEPHRFITQECPDVFRWGRWWYLVYSEFSDAFCTRYRIATSPDGPWRAPENDTVDGRAFYAAKTVELDGNRYFVGWIATKQDDRDAGAWQWAGTMAVLQAHQHGDGSLAFGLPDMVRAAYDQCEDVSTDFSAVNGAASSVGEGAGDRYAAWVGPAPSADSIITVDLDIADSTHACGLLLRTSDDGESGYVLRLEPQRNRLVFDRWPRGHTGDEQWQILGDVPHAVELERPVHLDPGRHRVEVHLDHEVCVAVVDDEVALSTRLYDHPAGRLGLFAQDGAFTLVSAEIRTRAAASA